MTKRCPSADTLQFQPEVWKGIRAAICLALLPMLMQLGERSLNQVQHFLEVRVRIGPQ
jgi:hypothetical protein